MIKFGYDSRASLISALVLVCACSQTGERTQETSAEATSKQPRAADQGSAPTPAGTEEVDQGSIASGHEASTAGAAQGEGSGTGAQGAVPLPPEGSGRGSTGMSWTAPSGWKEETPRSPMRRAQFRVPGADGDPEDAECVIFYFGPGQGGTAESNADRWVGQFTQPDGSSSQQKAKIAMRSMGGNQVMFVEVKGTYNPAPSMGSTSAGAPKPGYALLGAIVVGPDAPWFFKLTGPERTVEKNRQAFESLVTSAQAGA